MNVKTLNNIIEESENIVCISGNQMASDCGYPDIWDEEFAFEIEKRYGFSPEDIYNRGYFETRKENFFKFYRDELLKRKYKPSGAFYKLAELEGMGKLKCTITKSIFNLPQRAGCKNVINIHGNIANNVCPKCGRRYTVEYISQSKNYPTCLECKTPIKLGTKLIGEMLDNSKITKAMEAVAAADVLLILDTDYDSEEFGRYINNYRGNKAVLIKEQKEYSDINADFVIYDKAKNVLPKLGNSMVVMFDKLQAVNK